MDKRDKLGHLLVSTPTKAESAAIVSSEAGTAGARGTLGLGLPTGWAVRNGAVQAPVKSGSLDRSGLAVRN